MSLALFCIIYSELCQYQFSESSEFSVREIPVEISHHTLTFIPSSAILQVCSHKRMSFTVLSRAAMFTKFGKRLHKLQQPKRFRLHGTSRFDFFIRQISKSTIFFL